VEAEEEEEITGSQRNDATMEKYVPDYRLSS
jgi:hypothetical protein